MRIHRITSVFLLIVLGSGTDLFADQPATAPASQPALPKMDHALSRAIEKGDMPRVKHLIESGAPVNTEGDSPLSEAVVMKNTEIARFLIAHGANPDSQNNWGCSALYCAAYIGDVPMAKVLIEAGARDGLNDALDTAAFHGYIEMARLLLDSGADPNVKDVNKMTPVEVAKWRHHQDIADLIATYKPKDAGKP
jgi:ankyrin repeat protein